MSELAIVKKNVVEEKQYIVFHMEKEFYGIDIANINCIIQVPKITPIPKMPEYFQGVISLRGHVIPVINLRKRMNLADVELTKESRIIVLNLENDELMGIIVDDVKEVMNISNNEIEEPSPFVKRKDSFISGVGKKQDELISIFEVDLLTA